MADEQKQGGDDAETRFDPIPGSPGGPPAPGAPGAAPWSPGGFEPPESAPPAYEPPPPGYGPPPGAPPPNPYAQPPAAYGAPPVQNPYGAPPPGAPPPGAYPPYGGQPYGGQPYGYAPQPYAGRKTNGMAIAALVLGILWLYWLGSILALIFGYVGKSQIDKSNGTQDGRGLAIAGIVLGWIGVATLLIVIVIAIAGSSSN
ncbi:MAG: hypothetical protein QOJ07_956 [Thermoleophilaceae bacterium]|nr:hypothetical protein [Thermoleophilaceae bacterium]